MTTNALPPGATIETAIVVSAAGSGDSIQIECEHVHRMFGRRWRLKRQSLLQLRGRSYDAWEIEDGDRLELVYFDITSVLPPEPAGGAR